MIKKMIARFHCEGCGTWHLFRGHRNLCRAVNLIYAQSREKDREQLERLIASLRALMRETGRVADMVDGRVVDAEVEEEEDAGVTH